MKKEIFVILMFCLQFGISRRALFIIDYQNDFLFGGRLGENPTQQPGESTEDFNNRVKKITDYQDQVKENVEHLLHLFVYDYIFFSQDKHNPDSLSFLSTHIRRNQNNPEILKYLTDLKESGEIKKAQIIYETKTINKKVESENTYSIKKINYFEKEELSDGETELMQEMWPDHCVNYPKEMLESISEKDQKGIDIESELRTHLMSYKENGSKVFRLVKGNIDEIDSYSVVRNNLGNLINSFPEALDPKEVKEIYVVGVATEYCVLNSARDLAKLYPKTRVKIITDATISIGPMDEVLEDIYYDHEHIQLIKTREALGFITGQIHAKMMGDL